MFYRVRIDLLSHRIDSNGLEKVETILSDIIQVFSAYSEGQRGLFAKQFISIVMWNPNSTQFNSLIQV